MTTGGMAGAGYMENIDPALYDERAMAYLFDRYRPHLYGFKLRIGKDISEGMGLRPLEMCIRDSMDSLYGASIIRDFNIVVCAVGDTEQRCV